MDIALEKKLYLDGIHLFNEGEFFDAHEVWEDCWHAAQALGEVLASGEWQREEFNQRAAVT